MLTKNKYEKAVVYENFISSSNFKSRFKSIVSDQQTFNQVGIDKFFRALQKFGVNKDDMSGAPINIKYNNVALYCTHQRNWTPTKYVD